MDILRELLHPLNLAVFLVMISVLVAAHEFGHYLFARLFNMGVEEFAIGFGRPKIWTYLRRTYRIPLLPGQVPQQLETEEEQAAEQIGAGQKLAYALEGGVSSHPRPIVVETTTGPALQETTDFTIRAWPLGGFVRIKGMLPEADGSETRVAGGFYSKPPWQRLVVLFAGPLFSVVAGILLLAPLFVYIGKREPFNRPVIDKMLVDSAAASAGLKPGDVVKSIEGKPVETFYDLVAAVRDSAGTPLEFVYERKGVTLTTVVTPKLSDEPIPRRAPDLSFTAEYVRQGQIGVLQPAGFERVRLSWADATNEALLTPVVGVKNLVERITKPRALKDSVGGIGTMLAATKSFTEDSGVWGVIELAALLSISVGIFNLLPFPPLDGGQMMIAFAEMLRRGKRLSLQVQGALAMAGFAIVMTMFVAVLYIDFGRFVGPKDGGLRFVGEKAAESAPKK